MADGVEAALEHMRFTERCVKDAEQALSDAHKANEEARAEFIDARDAFHKEYPEMGSPSVAAADMQAGPPVGAGAEQAPEVRPEPAEPVPVMTSNGPVVFREMDDSPF